MVTTTSACSSTSFLNLLHSCIHFVLILLCLTSISDSLSTSNPPILACSSRNRILYYFKNCLLFQSWLTRYTSNSHPFYKTFNFYSCSHKIFYYFKGDLYSYLYCCFVAIRVQIRLLDWHSIVYKKYLLSFFFYFRADLHHD